MNGMKEESRLYRRTPDGGVINAPAGWVVLEEGERVPAVHREYHRDCGWCTPRRGASTMTPLVACVWGSVRAIAIRAGADSSPAAADRACGTVDGCGT